MMLMLELREWQHSRVWRLVIGVRGSVVTLAWGVSPVRAAAAGVDHSIAEFGLHMWTTRMG